MQIKYHKGDATSPIGSCIHEHTRKANGKLHVIAHCCNDIGAWGAGFVLALDKRFGKEGDTSPRKNYLQWARTGTIEKMPFKQGQCHLVRTSYPSVAVANIIGQSGCGYTQGLAPVRYGSINEGLLRLRSRLLTSDWELHMPRMGAGLAGGDWEDGIYPILAATFGGDDLNINVYDYTEADFAKNSKIGQLEYLTEPT